MSQAGSGARRSSRTVVALLPAPEFIAQWEFSSTGTRRNPIRHEDQGLIRHVKQTCLPRLTAIAASARDWRIYTRLFLEPRIFGYNHALMMKVGSGQW